MPGYVVRRVQHGLNDRRKAVNGARILVLGIAYKKNTNDARETPAVGRRARARASSGPRSSSTTITSARTSST